jgi:hypothetical protein
MRGHRRKVVETRPAPLVVRAGHRRALEAVGADGWLWLPEELSFVWREAQTEATRAYRNWCRRPGRASYSAYRAAQDRADAAHAALSERRSAERSRRSRAA